MQKRILMVVAGVLLFVAGYVIGGSRMDVAYAQAGRHAGLPKSYGHVVSAVVTPGGTSLVLEDSQGTIRFVTMTGEVEGVLERK